jgi:mannose-6-phosphate isomerase
VEQARGVMREKTAAGKVAAKKMDGFTRLIEQKYFVVDRYDLTGGGKVGVPTTGAGCLVGLSGSARVIGAESEVELVAGQAVVVPVGCDPVTVSSEAGASFVKCWAP